MPEYIERGAALKEIDQSYGLYEASLRVSGIPTADVAPVRHGRWNSDETCSCCEKKSTEGLDAEKWNYWFPDFCPHCGAIMSL